MDNTKNINRLKAVGRNLTSLKQLKKGTYVINDKTVVVK